ncbi:hypothetical protein PVAND_011793 [Polypedilum vanderplanki]|uniref:Ribosomal RNA-processing protein 14/surfeit locus protein 6 C-terminal domain-containing protein n=1 Tax=Polypedilum vanderplanki TaxID=319348 RepID=A0A9J6CJP9_POLVA|nr:hypothetical protein PVAND_011793 [Polypedilum vanderplanki]
MSCDKKEWMQYLRTENDYMTFLLEGFHVPETNQNESDDEYLLDVPNKKPRFTKNRNEPAESIDELQEREKIVKNKLEQRKATKGKSKNALTKADRRRMKLEKLEKVQKMQSLKKIMTNEVLKQDQVAKDRKVNHGDEIQKNNEKKSKVFNKEGKLFFSKVEIEGEVKNKNKGKDTNPQANLHKLKSQKKKIRELIESGEKSKAKDEKQKMLWESAFQKTEGIKVKDNEEILKKTIKKRKDIKKKSKEKWNERKKKVADKQAAQQKKREDNINKRKTDKQKSNLKKAIKKGRTF